MTPTRTQLAEALRALMSAERAPIPLQAEKDAAWQTARDTLTAYDNPPPAPYVRTLAQHLSACLQHSTDPQHQHRRRMRLDSLTGYLPSGSGIDRGTQIDYARCTPQRIVLDLSFHHMDEHGSYDGWTDHTAVITPAFDGIDVRITGRNRNGIKDYLADVLRHAMAQRLALNADNSHTLQP